MADVYRQLARGTLGTASATLYTVPAARTTIVKSLILSNRTATACHATILFDGTHIVWQHVIPANDGLPLPELNAILMAGMLVTGSAQVAGAIDFYLSGLEMVVP